MLPDSLKSSLLRDISVLTQKTTEFIEFRFVSGGCINSAGKLETNSGSFFVKWNNANRFPGMFEAEQSGLSLLAADNLIRIPSTITCGRSQDYAYIIMEWIETGPRSKKYWQNLGEQLVTLHRQSNTQYGLDHDNYIGSLPQSNSFSEYWIDFFIEKRIEIQLNKALSSGRISSSHVDSFNILYNKLPEILTKEPPSLLHGDLWSGNLMTGESGQPVLIDPAVYFGNREIEIAFTRLFGGFDSEFYSTYNELWPFEPGFNERQDIYNLYPLLVHVNLFGGGYLSQVESILKRFT